MCGIIAVVKKEDDGVPTAPVIMNMFKQQIQRGQQGFGYVAFDKDVRAYIRRQNKEEIEKALSLKSARSIMFHHRIPTSTPNLADTTHPIKVSHKELRYDYYVEHNGMISNDSIMHDEHVELGYVYNTVVTTEVRTANDSFKNEQYNDSEAFAIDLVRAIEGKQEEMQSKGSIAFIALQVNKKTNEVLRVFFGHNAGNPLTYHFTQNALILRSEGEKESVSENRLISLQLSDWSIEDNEFKIGEYATVRNHYGSGHYGGYNGYAPDDDVEDDRMYGVGTRARPNKEEEEIISIELEKQEEKLEEEIQDLMETEIQLLADIQYYDESGDTALADDTRIQLSKNREKINDLEFQQSQLGIDTVVAG